jgi:hypothetical protein
MASIPTLSRSSVGGRCSCPGMLARRPARSSTPAMAARLAASPSAGLVLPRLATIRPNLDQSRCALPYPSMSLLDVSERLLPTGLVFRGNTIQVDGLSPAVKSDFVPGTRSSHSNFVFVCSVESSNDEHRPTKESGTKTTFGYLAQA